MKRKQIIKEVLIEFFSSEEGISLMREALNRAMSREMTFEKRKDEETNLPISPPKIMIKNTNVIDELLIYISRMEGAFQGLQNKITEIENNNRRLMGSYKNHIQLLKAFDNLPGRIEGKEEKKKLEIIDGT